MFFVTSLCFQLWICWLVDVILDFDGGKGGERNGKSPPKPLSNREGN